MIVICEFVRNFSTIYVTTKQKADICNSFQVIVHIPNAQWHSQEFATGVRNCVLSSI